MKYFVSRNIYTFNSGTEHAQANRTLMFNMFGDQAKYVTRDYNRLWVRDAERINLNETNVLNMYDYFQETTDVATIQRPVRKFSQIPFDEYQLVEHGPNYSTVDHAGRQLARINILPGTVGLVGDVEYYDRMDMMVTRDNYDWRGFKSSVDYFHPNGELGVRRFLNQEGEVVLENLYMNVDGQLQPTMWKLINFHGKDYRFDTENQLFLFFLNEVMKETKDNVIVSDHRDLDAVVADVQGANSKWVAFHGSHVDNHGTVFAAFTTALQARSTDFDGIIVPTVAQKAQIEHEFSELNVVKASDVAILNEEQLNQEVWLRDRIEGRIIFSGRLEADKRPMETLQTFFKVAKQVPTTSLEYRGYTNDQALLNEMKQQVEQQGLTDRVIFGDYLTDDEMNKFYDQAQVIVNTSVSEAQGMNLVEAISHGVPIVSYDTNFGLKTLVENDVNGYVVTNGDHDQMARRVQQILTNNVLWSKLSKAAYQKAQNFTAKRIYQEWKDIFNQ